MKAAFILFNGVTMLDFIGFYDPISRLKSQGYVPNLSWDICSFTDTVQDSFGLTVEATRVRQSLDAYDLIFVPGGFGTRTLMNDRDFLNWLKTAQNVPYKVSVCTGSLLLGAAGFLQDRMATTNFKEYETLKRYCPNVKKVRIVEDRNVITAGAVASSLDLGLYVCEKFAGVEAREAIRANMDYPKVEVTVKKAS
ncbi:DJ-1/PfpI family protein [Persicitalea jodogahamensis]|uniref:DJ-1/PfpI domain-containing protein n=1 Tax=Persicitalea jodogahamensis TaxID=402147 RepID=A0A8J3D680_9BACT|nr:DJ-1/PfpI family protein [Persicitalea jodogahamensis]GHB58399.1 hypothetical protein GCM10007390_09860 [Persicitalea jodogahamensis]